MTSQQMKKFFEKNIDSEKWLEASDSEQKFAHLLSQTAIKLALEFNTEKKISKEKFLKTLISFILGKKINRQDFEIMYSNFIKHLDVLEKQTMNIKLKYYLKDFQGKKELIELLIKKGITNNHLLLEKRNLLNELQAESAYNFMWETPQKKQSKLKMQLESCKQEVQELKKKN